MNREIHHESKTSSLRIGIFYFRFTLNKNNNLVKKDIQQDFFRNLTTFYARNSLVNANCANE